MSGTVGPPGSWSDYNHYEVSVTVANPRAVFGRGAIDMMGSIQSIATSAPGRDARRKWFNPGISLAPSRDAAAATAAVRLGPATCLNRGDTQRQSPRASDLDTCRPTNPKIGGTMKTASLLRALLLCAACPASALAQSADDLKNDEKTPGDVLVYGMGYSGNRYSPLTQINKDNVKSWSRNGPFRSPTTAARRASRSSRTASSTSRRTTRRLRSTR